MGRLLRLTRDSAALLPVLFFVFLSVAGPWIWGGQAEATDVAIANQSLSGAHWMGTDDLGRDILARTLVATRSSLVLAVLATLVGGFVGIVLGVLSGVSRRLGRTLGAVINLLTAFPALLLAIFFAVLFGIGSVGSVLAVGASFAPGFARITQTLTASVVSKEYVEASRVLGRGHLYVTVRHILPNIAEPIILYGTIHIGTAVLALSGLSFLGLGVQPPTYDWGRLLNDGLVRIYVTPGVAIAPAVAIVLAGLAFNLAGERLSDLIAGRGERRTATAPPALPPAADEPAPTAGETVVDVRRLRVHFAARGGGVTTPVREVSLTLAPGDRVGIVGESGSGKSLTAAAIAGLVDFPGRVEADRLSVMDVDPRSSGRDTDRVLGRNVAMVFQDPGEALNPAVKLGTQLAEPARLHLGQSRAQARTRAVEALRSVAIPDPARRLNQHQHELSGGMKQRVCIAIGLMGEARLLIADEPTTALDVTVQRQILRLVDSLGGETAAALLFISHDIAVVAEICDRIVVMYAGFVVEEAATPDLLAAPAHPYTGVLLAASPHMGLDRTAALSTIDGRMPGPEVDLPGCYFAARCPRADETCRTTRPALHTVDGGPGHRVACHHPVVPAEVVT